MKDAGLLKDLSIEIVMKVMKIKCDPIELSKKDIIEAAKRADIALGYEDGDGLSTTAVISRRGSADWMLTVKYSFSFVPNIQPKSGYRSHL